MSATQPPRWLRWTGPGATFVLGLLCLALAAVLVLGMWGRSEEGTTRPVAADPVTSDSARAEALEVAPALAGRLLSYDWEGIGTQAGELDELLSASFAEEYAASLADVEQEVVADRVSVRAEVRDAGVVAAGPSRGVALVYLDQVSTTAGSAGERRDQVRVLVTVTRDGGQWRVSRIDAF
jgi:Mce-associated membrane protein